jgi:hypothetical protein
MWLPSPPPMVIRWSPSMSGCAAYPHTATFAWYSSFNCFCHTILPSAAVKQIRSPIAPRVYTLSESKMGVQRGPAG